VSNTLIKLLKLTVAHFFLFLIRSFFVAFSFVAKIKKYPRISNFIKLDTNPYNIKPPNTKACITIPWHTRPPLATPQAVVLLSAASCHAGLLGAGTGEGSCAAAPFRALAVKWPLGCPANAPCCSEFGYCQSEANWHAGVFRDCNGVSNGAALPEDAIIAENTAAAHGDPAGLALLVVPAGGSTAGAVAHVAVAQVAVAPTVAEVYSGAAPVATYAPGITYPAAGYGAAVYAGAHGAYAAPAYATHAVAAPAAAYAAAPAAAGYAGYALPAAAGYAGYAAAPAAAYGGYAAAPAAAYAGYAAAPAAAYAGYAAAPAAAYAAHAAPAAHATYAAHY